MFRAGGVRRPALEPERRDGSCLPGLAEGVLGGLGVGEMSSIQKQQRKDVGGGHAGTFQKAIRGPLSGNIWMPCLSASPAPQILSLA